MPEACRKANSDRHVETSSARLQAASHDVNVHGFPGANHHPATERSDFAGPFDPYAYRQPATTLQPPNKVKVEKGYFKQDCLVCAKGFDPKSQKQLRTHLKMDKHTKEYKLDSTSDGSHDRYCCCSTIFVGKDSWADHIVECHCRSSDVLGSRPTSRTHSAASLQGVSTPESSLYTNSSSSSRRKAYSKPSIIHNGGGQIYDPNTSSSGRYAGGSSYQGTPGSGVTRNTSFSSTGSRRYSGVSDLYEGSPNAAKMSGFFESAPAPTSQPRIHLEPPYLPQTVASAISPNEQLPYAKDPSGNYLFDGSGNSLHRTFNGFLVCYGRTGLIRLVDGQPVFAYPDPGSGNIIAYHYGVDVG
ncbi:unnamed protein product [Alternaria alternata]|jgi:hypothetical protein|uniref:Uncharacterized protein n=1 Tax=Alternaria alternata TaxID=5599 RepID=A0A4Q4N9X0_ALTAL|nr:hypothetical protein AA0117_g9061 [Alternaria alternata]